MTKKNQDEKEKFVAKLLNQLSPDINTIKLVDILKAQADSKMTRVYSATKIINLNS